MSDFTKTTFTPIPPDDRFASARLGLIAAAINYAAATQLVQTWEEESTMYVITRLETEALERLKSAATHLHHVATS